jgi:peptidoglycan/LPS O-acetylase OafA/YrhL
MNAGSPSHSLPGPSGNSAPASKSTSAVAPSEARLVSAGSLASSDSLATSRRPYQFDFLDILRGVAILAVMLLHFTEGGRKAKDPLLHARLWPVLQHGYLGVQLFFVISGYCIAAAVYALHGRERALSTFLYRRARRIFPPYWWSILVTVTLGLVTVGLLRRSWSDVFPQAAWEWGANVLLLQGPVGARDVNLVYWSLSIEFQFYLVMVLSLLAPRWTEAWLLGVSVLTCGLLATRPFPLWGTVFAYWLEFTCGIAAFYWITRRHHWPATPWLLLGCVAWAAGWQWAHYPVAIAESGRVELPLKLAFCAAWTPLLVVIQRHDVWLSGLRGLGWLHWMGLASYSLYLTHVPLGSRVFNLAERLGLLHGPRWLVPAGGAMALALVGGWLFHRFCEQPWMNVRPASSGVSRSAPLVEPSPTPEATRFPG